jgi:hypothetical protein
LVQLTGYFAEPDEERSAGCPADNGKSPQEVTFAQFNNKIEHRPKAPFFPTTVTLSLFAITRLSQKSSEQLIFT